MNSVSDFLVRFFFLLIQISSVFACGLQLRRKTCTPYFSLLVSLLFSTNNIHVHCMQIHRFFSWQHPFQTKLLFFQIMESVKRAFASRAGSGKLALLHALFLENEKENSRQKFTGQCFSIKSKVTCKNLAHLEAKEKTA